MATLQFDLIAVDFVGRIPTTFKTSFTAGNLMGSDGTFVLTKDQVVNFVNRALQKFFNDSWKLLGKKIIEVFPELSKYSAALTLTSGNYTRITPHLDLYKILGAVGVTGNKYIRPVMDDKYTLYLSKKYDEFIPTNDAPAIIQVTDLLAVFPQTFAENIQFNYVRTPVDPITGEFIIQDTGEDSPYYSHWNHNIADIAYQMYLAEASETL